MAMKIYKRKSKLSPKLHSTIKEEVISVLCHFMILVMHMNIKDMRVKSITNGNGTNIVETGMHMFSSLLGMYPCLHITDVNMHCLPSALKL